MTTDQMASLLSPVCTSVEARTALKVWVEAQTKQDLLFAEAEDVGDITITQSQLRAAMAMQRVVSDRMTLLLLQLIADGRAGASPPL